MQEAAGKPAAFLLTGGFPGDRKSARSSAAPKPINDGSSNTLLVAERIGNYENQGGSGATAESGEPLCEGLPAENTVWYRYVAPVKGYFVVEIKDDQCAFYRGLRMQANISLATFTETGGFPRMRRRAHLKVPTIIVLGGLVVYLAWWNSQPEPDVILNPRDVLAPVEETATPAVDSTPESRREVRKAMVDAKLARKLRQGLEQKNARPNELILGFKDAAAYRRFLERASRVGVSVLKQLDRLNLARVKLEDLAAFEADLAQNGNDYADVDANLLVFPPTVPEQDERVAGTQAPFSTGLAEFIGATGDIGQWGAGVTVAILDSGVAGDATFGSGKVRYFDVGMGTLPLADDGHGTGVAALVAGRSADALGIAQGADILSIRVTAADGLSDAFTLTQGIMAAVDNGASVINISLGSYGPSLSLANAIEYATSMGRTIVASAGNDQATQLTWPAAHPSVVSVGAVDANGKQVIFSNAGDGLSISAPGYGVPTAWTNNQRVYADGTSFSAPIVSASIAAIMTNYPGMTSAQAWQVIQNSASDGGPAGPDPDYGAGIVNLTWARHYNDPAWHDTAVSSHYVNSETGALDVVVQNRSGNSASSLKLEVEVNGKGTTYPIPNLGPGGTYVASLPINTAELTNAGRLDFTSKLEISTSQVDNVPKNNWKGSSLSVPGK